MSRPVAIILTVAWLAGLALVATVRPSELIWFGFLTGYLLALAYSVRLWTRGDPDGTAAIVIAVLLPIVGWIVIGLKALVGLASRDQRASSRPKHDW